MRRQLSPRPRPKCWKCHYGSARKSSAGLENAACCCSASFFAHWTYSTVKHIKKCLDELTGKRVFGVHRDLSAAELDVQSPALLTGVEGMDKPQTPGTELRQKQP